MVEVLGFQIFAPDLIIVICALLALAVTMRRTKNRVQHVGAVIIGGLGGPFVAALLNVIVSYKDPTVQKYILVATSIIATILIVTKGKGLLIQLESQFSSTATEVSED